MKEFKYYDNGKVKISFDFDSDSYILDLGKDRYNIPSLVYQEELVKTAFLDLPEKLNSIDSKIMESLKSNKIYLSNLKFAFYMTKDMMKEEFENWKSENL